jgi:hypothetical protein
MTRAIILSAFLSTSALCEYQLTPQTYSAPSAFPKREAEHSPMAGFRGHQLSSAERFARQLQSGGQMPSATEFRTAQMLSFQVRQVSQRDNLDGDNANGRASVTVDQVFADLPALANGVGFGRSSVAGIETAGSAIGKRGQDAVCLRHGQSGGDQRVRDYGHQMVSFVDRPNIGPLALSSQEVFSA